MTDAPHVPSRLDKARAAPRCGARRKHDGGSCEGAAMKNGRCRFHGGKSTGAKTPEGAERARQAALRHGYYAGAATAERRQARVALACLRQTMANLK